jgi:hypothetical protein
MNKHWCVWMKAIAFAFLPLFFTGCTTSRDVSQSHPFNNYVGKTVELQAPVWVVNRKHGNKIGVDGLRRTQYGIAEAPGHGTLHGYFGEALVTLPQGHPVTIDSVRYEVWSSGDYDQITAYGRTTLPPGTNEVSFAYAWGGGNIMRLWCAPWEPEGTPNRKYSNTSNFEVSSNNFSPGDPQGIIIELR